MRRKNRLNTLKYRTDVNRTDVKFIEEVYQNNPFNDWINNFDNPKKLIASIPFVRNLAEFTGDKNNYDELTCFLHMKDNTPELKIQSLKEVFEKILKNGTNKIENTDNNFLCVLTETSSKIKNEIDDNMQLEDKITLSISIRLEVEKFIISPISHNDSITRNQTYKLVEKYKKDHPDEIDKIKILDKVLLMTPENIHVNSFMYEPIIDISGDHLKKLYREVMDLQIKK